MGLGPLFRLSLEGLDVRDISRQFAIEKRAAIVTLSYRPDRSLNISLGASLELNEADVFISGDALDQDETLALSEEALFARATVGLDLRFTQRFAVHPSVTIFHGLKTGDASVILAGCAFRIGGPAYEGLSF